MNQADTQTGPPPTPAPPTKASPDALLLIAPGCPHCGTNLAALTDLIKTGVVGRLEIINIAERPEAAQQLGVRSVPWTRIGPFTLDGARGPTELRRWAERVNDPIGMAEYFGELLGDGKLGTVNELIHRAPALLMSLLPLLQDPDTGVHIRVGIGAALEELDGSSEAWRLVEGLGELSRDQDPRTRQDACHYLGLIRSPDARPFLEPRLEDPDPLVREIAAEALDELGDSDTP